MMSKATAIRSVTIAALALTACLAGPSVATA